MLHQMIFAHPKPGMSEQEFQKYWREKHAPIASKIPHTTRYLIASRIPLSQDKEFPFSGVGETWFKDEQEALEAIQSQEYVEGARPDEPNWAAFWQVLALNTTDHPLKEEPSINENDNLVKIIILFKRKPGMLLADFREYWLETHSSLVLSLPSLRRYVQCHVRDTSYIVGEPNFDGVEQLWFDNIQAVEKIMRSPEYKEHVMLDLANFTDSKYIFSFAADEYWVVKPEHL